MSGRRGRELLATYTAVRAVVFDYGMVLTDPPDAEAHDALVRITGLVPEHPAIPAGLEEIEGRVLDRIKAAN